VQFPLIGRLQGLPNEDQAEWLRQSIIAVNNRAWQLSLSETDFQNEVPDQWEPIPIDRSDPLFQKAERDVENALEEIESSNGYAATAPNERNYVVDQLSNFVRYLKNEGQIQWMQIKVFALEPLARVIERFGNAAVGLAANAAKQAILDWLKKCATKIFDWYTI
jgi:hypothetical protein